MHWSWFVRLAGDMRAVPRRQVKARSLGTRWNCVRTHTVRAEAISLPTHRPSYTWASCSTVLLEHCLARAVPSLLS